MALTNDQKNIVNPNAATMKVPENLPLRSGVGYDYTTTRNKFIIDVIHELYNSYYEFPASGRELNVGPVEGESYTIGIEDLLAYCAMYPQNGKVQRQENGGGIIVSVSEEEASAQLDRLDRQLGEQNNYYSDTAPLSFDPENTNQRYKLVFIDPNHSAEYVALMRRALGKEDVEPLNPQPTLNNTLLPPELTSFISSDSTVDLDNWLVNCQPGTETKKTYYNSRDQRFYYTQRTRNTAPSYYDLSYFYPDDPDFNPDEDELDEDAQAGYDTVVGNLEKALETGVEAILKSVGKFSTANKNAILNSSPKRAYIMTYLDVRPASRWCFCVQIERSVINSLEDVNVVSYEEDELWILEKAQTLASPEKTPIAFRQTFVFDDLLDYIRSTQRMLELFAEDMAEEGIFSLPLASAQLTDREVVLDPDSRSGLLFLEDEIARLNGFADFLQTFFTYNKRSLLPETVVEFFLDSQYRLLHICANGELLTRGLGNINYIKRSENEQVGKILNAFSFLTSTTFSYLMSSKEIHEKFLSVAPGGVGFASGEEWSTFIPEYTYPEVIIDPDSIKLAHKENEELRKRKDALFVRLSKVLDVSPQQAERLYQNKISDKKWVRQRVTELVKGVNCSTAQAQLANDIVGFWNAANEKNNVRALIRESIQLLRREISNDAVASITIGGKRAELRSHDLLAGASRLNQQLDLDATKRKDQGFGDALNVAYNSDANNALLLKQVESVINSQISCAIDSFGNVLQNGFLDPVGLPPDSGKLIAREIQKPIKFEIKKMKMISMKKDQSDYYWKIIETAIQQLLKSLITGIARDVFAAALGCGPNPTQTDQLDNSLKRYDFGYSMLSEHVGDVNLRQISINTGFVIPAQDEGDDITAPSPDQLDAFLKDVSIMCTPAELQQLLFGEADNVLYELIYETVSNGPVVVKIGEEPKDGFIADVQRAVSGGEDGMIPIYYTINPAIYASVIKTKDIIREFFAAIGDALIPGEINAVDDMSFQSPLEAYCAGKNPNVEPLRLRVGIEQIQSQYVQVMDSRIDKINSLCQWLQDLSQNTSYH